MYHNKYVKRLKADTIDTNKEIIISLQLIKEVVFTNFVEENYK